MCRLSLHRPASPRTPWPSGLARTLRNGLARRMPMGLKPMHASHSTVLIGRRYLEHGFLDLAMRLFVRNAAQVEKRDWSLLVERLMDRHRIADAVRVCEIGAVPVPCAQLLALGDGSLQRKDFEAAIHLYELGNADRDRWARVVDLLSARPDQERRAIALTERYLVGEAPKVELRLAAAN